MQKSMQRSYRQGEKRGSSMRVEVTERSNPSLVA